MDTNITDTAQSVTNEQTPVACMERSVQSPDERTNYTQKLVVMPALLVLKHVVVVTVPQTWSQQTTIRRKLRVLSICCVTYQLTRYW
jgi:hypothetical protein